MARGYARNTRDEQRLIAAGVKPNHIYVEGRGHETLGNMRMRRGEELKVVEGLRALGNSRKEIVAAVAMIHGLGAVVVDAETGKRSDKNGVEMLDAALAKIRGEKTIGSAANARAMQAKSVATRTKGRMPERQAMAIWKDPTLTAGEALAKMRGWERGTAYAALGKRGVPTGRRSTKTE